MPTAFQKHLTAQNKHGQGGFASRTHNFAGGKGSITVTYNAADAKSPVEVMLCEEIGKDAWTGEGFTLKDLRDALNGVPTTRELNFYTNSPGGRVDEGVSIRNWLKSWKGNISNTIIGIAASAASWCVPAKNVRAYKNSQMFMHRSMGMVFGNADDCREAITQLEKTDGQIAEMYAEMTGKTAEEMMNLMKGNNGQGTLLTGAEALDQGLVHELVDGEATNQFTPEWLNSAKEKLTALNTLRATDGAANKSAAPATGNQNQTTTNTIMNKEKMIALLNKWGVTIPANATDEQLLALVEAGPKTTPTTNAAPALSNEDKALLESLRNQVAENRKREIRNALQQLASVDGGQRIPVNEIETWEKQALEAKDGPEGNPILNSLRKLPAQQVGIPALNDNSVIEMTGDSFKDVQKFVLANGPGFRKQFLGNKAGNELDPRTL